MGRHEKDYEIDWQVVAALMSAPHLLTKKQVSIELGIPYTTFIYRFSKRNIILKVN